MLGLLLLLAALLATKAELIWNEIVTKSDNWNSHATPIYLDIEMYIIWFYRMFSVETVISLV